MEIQPIQFRISLTQFCNQMLKQQKQATPAYSTPPFCQFIRNWLSYYYIYSNKTDACILYRLVQNTDLVVFKPLFLVFFCHILSVIVLLQDYISERISGFLKLESRWCSKMFTDRIVLILLSISASFLATFQSVHSHIKCISINTTICFWHLSINQSL